MYIIMYSDIHVFFVSSYTDDCMTRPTLCDRNAVCSRTSAGDHVCICNPGYRGDGTTCSRKYTYTYLF